MDNSGKTIDRRFRSAMRLLAMALVLLVLNNLIYNWVFLPQFFSEHPKTFFITLQQAVGYFKWMPGGLMTGLNMVMFVIAAILFRSGKKAASTGC